MVDPDMGVKMASGNQRMTFWATGAFRRVFVDDS